MSMDEILYQTSDIPNEIYFIHTGRVKLYVDLNDYIQEDKIVEYITNQEK